MIEKKHSVCLAVAFGLSLIPTAPGNSALASARRSHDVLILASERVTAALQRGEWVFVTEYDEHDPVRQAKAHVKLYIDPASVIGGTETSIGKRIFFLALKTYDAPSLLGAVKERISCEAALGEKWLLHFMEVRFYDSQDKEVGTPITDFGAWMEVDPNAPEPNFYKLTAAAKKALVGGPTPPS